MQPRQAIIVDGSRILRDLIKRILETKAGFDVVHELDDLQDVATTLNKEDAGWVFFVLSHEPDVSEAQKIELLVKHPFLRMVFIRVDGGHIDMEWLVYEHKDLTGMTLEELTQQLREEMSLL